MRKSICQLGGVVVCLAMLSGCVNDRGTPAGVPQIEPPRLSELIGRGPCNLIVYPVRLSKHGLFCVTEAGESIVLQFDPFKYEYAKRLCLIQAVVKVFPNEESFVTKEHLVRMDPAFTEFVIIESAKSVVVLN